MLQYVGFIILVFFLPLGHFAHEFETQGKKASAYLLYVMSAICLISGVYLMNLSYDHEDMKSVLSNIKVQRCIANIYN